MPDITTEDLTGTEVEEGARALIFALGDGGYGRRGRAFNPEIGSALDVTQTVQDKHSSKSGFGMLLAFRKSVPTSVGGNYANLQSTH